MEKLVYSNLGLRKNKTFQSRRESEMLTLKDFVDSKWTIQNKDELKIAFIRDLKRLLLKENLYDLIQSFFDLEVTLNLALEKLIIEDDAILNFEEFYKTLSPVLLRAILDNAKTDELNENLLDTIKESIRIAIEEEIYHIVDEYES